jgi:hygromycin-B 4-O-kinase
MAAPSLNPSDIQEAMSLRLHRSVELVPLRGGVESQVYLLVENRAEYVLRINRSEVGFKKDAFASRHFNSALLPVPAVIEIGHIDDVHSFCITARVPGTTLQDLSPEQLRRTLQSTMATMAAIAQCDMGSTKGYGVFDEHGVGSNSSWRSFLRSPSTLEWTKNAPLIRNTGIDSALQMLLELSENMQDFRNLVHGDFGSNNVLSDGTSITGVIDWSEAMIGDPLYDVANIFFWRTWLDGMDLLASFLEDTAGFNRDERMRLLCYQVHIGLREVYGSASQEDSVMTAWAIARLEEILSQAQ